MRLKVKLMSFCPFAKHYRMQIAVLHSEKSCGRNKIEQTVLRKLARHQAEENSQSAQMRFAQQWLMPKPRCAGDCTLGSIRVFPDINLRRLHEWGFWSILMDVKIFLL